MSFCVTVPHWAIHAVTESCSKPLYWSVCVETNGLNNVETRSKFYIVLWEHFCGICELYHGPRVMNLTNMKVSSKAVSLSPYIFPVLAEMKICQFMFLARYGLCNYCTYFHGSSTDIYQLCFWRNGESDIRSTPPFPFPPKQHVLT